MSKVKYNKGARVKIIRGRSGVGVSGEIFWKGDSRYSDGERLGIRGDDGETYWIDDGDAIRRVREQVFVAEQGVPVAEEMDDHDPVARHFLACAGNEAVATGRLLDSGQIGRMAVAASAVE